MSSALARLRAKKAAESAISAAGVGTESNADVGIRGNRTREEDSSSSDTRRRGLQQLRENGKGIAQPVSQSVSQSINHLSLFSLSLFRCISFP